jgi:hypothetical protein
MDKNMKESAPSYVKRCPRTVAITIAVSILLGLCRTPIHIMLAGLFSLIATLVALHIDHHDNPPDDFV